MTRDTRSTEDRQLTNTSSMSEAGPSMSRRLVEQAQLPPITVGQSDSRPSNSRQVIIEPQQDNNIGSPLSSSSERHRSKEELQTKRDKYGALLTEYERNKANRAKGKQNAHSGSLKSHQKKITCYKQRILEEMLTIMEQFNAKGFVYGMVTETSKPITGASDSLRAWWKRRAIFDKVGPAQIDQFYKMNALYSNVADQDNKSTAELLKQLSDPTLGSIMSLLMQHCNPPQRKFPFENGLPPPWWPTGQESWWGQTGIPTNEGPPPFRKPHDLRKKWKVALIITIIKLMCPNFLGPHYHVEQSRQLRNRMNAKERKFWTLALVAEAKQYCQNHPDMPADEAITFLTAYGGSSSSQIAPPISGHEAPHSYNPFEVMDQPPLAPTSNNTLAWPITVPQQGQLQGSAPEISAAPDQQLTMFGSFAPQYSPWAFSYSSITSASSPMYLQQSHSIGAAGTFSSGFRYHHDQAIPYLPFVQQPGDMPSNDETEDVQNQLHANEDNMEFGSE